MGGLGEQGIMIIVIIIIIYFVMVMNIIMVDASTCWFHSTCLDAYNLYSRSSGSVLDSGLPQTQVLSGTPRPALAPTKALAKAWICSQTWAPAGVWSEPGLWLDMAVNLTDT